jgi:tryptophanyl-tRNA synthetase
VPAHAELGWYLNCVARMGWLERMTQFKDKAGADKERASVGLFDYPVLQAADILAFKATHVPVGEDQKQHLELCRDIADRFNRDFESPGFFPLPEPLIEGPGARIMSLKDGTKKMSKSDPSELSRIALLDTADDISKKIRKAKTDAEPLPGEAEGLKGRPEAENLVGIYAALSGETRAQVLSRFAGQGFGAFKPALADLAVAHLAPIGERLRELLGEPGRIDGVLEDGARRARAIADPIMAQVRDVIGFWRPGFR